MKSLDTQFGSQRVWCYRARYSLIVSIETPNADVGIHTPVASQIGTSIEVEL